MAPLPSAWQPGFGSQRLLLAGDWSRGADRPVLVHAVRKLLPMVRSARRTATLRPLGPGAGPLLRRRLRRPGVEFGGDGTGAVLLCPTASPALGAALAAGIPAVITPELSESLGRPLGNAVRVGRLDRSFVLGVVELLADEAAWRQASAEAQSLG